MTEDERTDLMRRVRYWLGQGESALDLARAALTRAGELDPHWAQEFDSDAGVLRGKLDALRAMINHGARSHSEGSPAANKLN